MNKESIILDAISSGQNLAITTKRWGERIVAQEKLENGSLSCKVILVEKLGDSGHYRADTIALRDMEKVMPVTL